MSKKTGVELIAEERERQVTKEKPWTTEHDDTHNRNELAFAAISYAAPDYATVVRHNGGVVFTGTWPWQVELMRYGGGEWAQGSPPLKKSRIENLTIAGALIAAEIDRLQRVEEKRTRDDS